jgi:hypothetical protein
MVSTYSNTITQWPCFLVPYLEGTEPIVLKQIPSTGKQSRQSPNKMVNWKNDPLFS